MVLRRVVLCYCRLWKYVNSNVGKKFFLRLQTHFKRNDFAVLFCGFHNWMLEEKNTFMKIHLQKWSCECDAWDYDNMQIRIMLGTLTILEKLSGKLSKADIWAFFQLSISVLDFLKLSATWRNYGKNDWYQKWQENYQKWL